MYYLFSSQKAKILLLCFLLSGWNLIPIPGSAATKPLRQSKIENCVEAVTATPSAESRLSLSKKAKDWLNSNSRIGQLGAIDTKVKRELILYLYAHPEIFLRNDYEINNRLFEGVSFDYFIAHLVDKDRNKIPLSSVDVNYVLTHVGSEGLQNFMAKLVATNKGYFAHHSASSFIDLTFFGLPTQKIENQGLDLDRKYYEGNKYDANIPSNSPQAKELEMVGGTWLGLSINGYNTSYSDFYEVLRNLNLPANSLVVDMGSGLGRLGLMIGAIFPQLRYVGYEYHRFRLQPGLDFVKKHNLKNVDFIQADFSAPEFTPVPGDMFFFYYPNNRDKVMKATTDKLKQLAHKKQFYILSRMRVGDRQIDEPAPWLSEVPSFARSFRLYRTKALSSE